MVFQLVTLLAGIAAYAAAQTTELPDAVNGAAYSVQLHFLAVTPISATVSAGALPGGLTLSSDGLISGAPTIATSGDFNFTVKVTDSSQPAQTLTFDYHMRGLTASGAPAGAVACLSDCRGVFDSSFYIGLAIDSFAGSETLSYLNPGVTGKLQERAIGGFDFAYRLTGNPNVGPGVKSPKSLWIYGETVHGVRSVDVNCTQNPDLPVCVNSLGSGANPGDQLYYILRNATSLEGYMGLRYEFRSLQTPFDSPANLYIKAEAGFMSVAGASGSALDMHQIAIGAVATKGRFQDSYLQVGWGRSDTFATARRKRIKVDGYMQWKIPKVTDATGLSAFAQMLVDTDLGRGSDAIQTYIGINYDLGQFLHKQQ